MKRVAALSLCAGLALAGCEVTPPGLDTSLRPEARPTQAAPTYSPSARSLELRTYFRRLENDQMVRGLMRIDGNAVDAPFNERQLAENFVQIALFEEHGSASLSASGPRPSQLRRWVAPVRIGISHGASVPPSDRARQVMQTRAYATRLAQVTGHPIAFTASGRGNFTIYVVDEDERLALGPELQRRIPGISDTSLRTMIELSRSISCIVVAFSRSNRQNVYTDAVAIIRTEHPPASWRSCLHEEVAQGLGLPNDSPRARPSIFNDDEEFALLTGHDELLLSMLYDRRLRPGMTAAEATPIVRQLALEKLGGGPV